MRAKQPTSRQPNNDLKHLMSLKHHIILRELVYAEKPSPNLAITKKFVRELVIIEKPNLSVDISDFNAL